MTWIQCELDFSQTTKWQKKKEEKPVAFVLHNLINCDEIEKNYQFRSRTIASSAIGGRTRLTLFLYGLQNASPELITGHIERRRWCEMVAPVEFPQTYIHSLVIGMDGIFFVCTNDSLRGNRTIERCIEKRCVSSQFARNRERKKCNYFNSVIRRVKCGDIGILQSCVLFYFFPPPRFCFVLIRYIWIFVCYYFLVI